MKNKIRKGKYSSMTEIAFESFIVVRKIIPEILEQLHTIILSRHITQLLPEYTSYYAIRNLKNTIKFNSINHDFGTGRSTSGPEISIEPNCVPEDTCVRGTVNINEIDPIRLKPGKLFY